MFYGYILRSKKTRRFYAGHTEDPPNRLLEHNTGQARSTRHGIPWKLVHVEEFATRAEAMHWERTVKARGMERYLQDNGWQDAG
ncbi:MAG: GIY-YIG nuclease family protein [Ignavibacteriae bacterium]|nr:GIY-YIG nuclease family protein [Ignavibacteriota bacterium]